MANKHCLVYETLGAVTNLKITEASGDGLMRLEGVFGVCGIKNQNNRIYDKENYRQMVESLQNIIKTQGCPGELEHPNSMNINLENVSHKIESIQMNEDGTITGTICLLNTPKGQIAKAIVEGGLPLYISSRGAGTITNEGRVTLSSIKTYDLVGTPGFSQAQLKLKQNQTLECLNESLNEDDENQIWAIVEGDDLLDDGDDDDKKDDKKKEDKKDDKKEDDKKEDDKKDDKEDKDDSDNEHEEDSEEASDDKKEDKEKTEDNKNNNSDIKMKDLKNAIDKLADKVTSLEAELHIAKESLRETQSSVKPTNYDAIEQWVSEEFAEQFKSTIEDTIEEKIDQKMNESVEAIANGVQNWVTEEFAVKVQDWVTEEFAPEVQNWITEEFSPEVQNWVTEQFAPEVQNWVTEEFAPEVQNWITEEFVPVVDSWINEEFAQDHLNKVNESVSSYLAEHKAGRLDEIDSLLETISANNTPLENIVKENENENKFKGVYVVEHMPSQYKPSWEMLNEERQNEILRSSKMYDFTKEGVLESFWANIDFEKKEEKIVENVDPITNYHNNVFSQMMRLRKTY